MLRGLEREPGLGRLPIGSQPQIVSRGYVNSKRWATAVRQATVGQVASIRHFGTAVQIEIWLRHLGRAGRPQVLTGVFDHQVRSWIS